MLVLHDIRGTATQKRQREGTAMHPTGLPTVSFERGGARSMPMTEEEGNAAAPGFY
jgi:hypothetical protein